MSHFVPLPPTSADRSVRVLARTQRSLVPFTLSELCSPQVEPMSGRVAPSHDHDDWYADPPCPDVTVTDNPIVGTILGPDGHVLVQIHERPPIGFR